MHRGYIKLWRRMKDSNLWLSEKFTRGQAWLDMLILANHKPGYIRKRGIRVEVNRGQVGMSERTLSDRWRWSRGKVRRFLSELETEQQIEPQKGNVTSLITITNYNLYQSNSTASDTTDGPQTDHRQYQNKNDKNDKNTSPPKSPAPKKPNLKRDYPYPQWLDRELFFVFWSMRSRIKKPITTERTITRLLNALKKLIDAGHSQQEIVELAIEKCWQTFYAPYDQ